MKIIEKTPSNSTNMKIARRKLGIGRKPQNLLSNNYTVYSIQAFLL